MGIKPPTACVNSACSGLAVERGLCADCLKSSTATPISLQSKHDYHREWSSLYKCRRWQDLRAAVLRRDPVCVECHRKASTVADHKEDHRGNIFRFYDITNLRGVCKKCHDEKTGKEHGIGNREPSKPGTVNGKVIDRAPVRKVEPGTVDTTFDFKAALTKNRSKG